MYFAVLVACTLHQCYRLGIYSKRPFETQFACEVEFSYIETTLYPRSPTLHVLCMTQKEWLALPEYRR